MILYRIVKSDYAEDLTGTGARLFGGRWNSEGKPAIYASSSKALAVLEVLVHLPPLTISHKYYSVEISVPEKSISEINIADLPFGWNDIVALPALKKIGDDFLDKMDHLLLRVPSVIVPTEYNYLLNPRHQGIKKVKIVNKEPFSFDKRLRKN